jgi:hypothetical protein
LAAFAGNRINSEVLDRVKAATVLAEAALGTFFLVYKCNLSAPELLHLLFHRLEQQMKIRCVHIAIGQHRIFSQGRQ